NYAFATSRILAKLQADVIGQIKRISEPGYYQTQLMWKYSMPFLPEIEKEYDVAISYLWPHDFVAKKVKAKSKIAWIHTDYSTLNTKVNVDISIWSKFDYIIAVSEACKKSFVTKYKSLSSKVLVIENIVSPDLIRKLAFEELENPILDDTRFKIVTVGRLSYAKGIDNAIKTLKAIKDKGYSEIVWYVVGYGGDEEKLRKLIKTNNLQDSFFLLGKKVNPYPFIKAANLYVQPSRYEGKAVTVTEAMILGKAILITNYTTAQSQLNSGEDGLICDMTIEGLTTGILKFYKNRSLLEELSMNIQLKNFNNRSELEKLYKII
ncbi:MAG: glycosyltransferase, partial [Campylobacterales bacterium]|nr:glycosyltransferase [Campylobacterales bacterium]